MLATLHHCCSWYYRFGGTLKSFKDRVKTLDSTTRKLRLSLIDEARKLLKKGESEESVRAQVPELLVELCNRLCDLNRYTVIFPKDEFVRGVAAMLAVFEQLKVKNYFGDGSCFWVRTLACTSVTHSKGSLTCVRLFCSVCSLSTGS